MLRKFRIISIFLPILFFACANETADKAKIIKESGIDLTHSNFGDQMKMMIDSISIMKVDSLNSQADLYWRIIAKGEKAIPYLIENLVDTTPTAVSFCYFSSAQNKNICKKLNVSEITYFALDKICPIPVWTAIQMQCCTQDNFYDLIFDSSFKIEMERRLAKWYLEKKSKIHRITIPDSLLNESQIKYHISSYYEMQ